MLGCLICVFSGLYISCLCYIVIFKLLSTSVNEKIIMYKLIMFSEDGWTNTSYYIHFHINMSLNVPSK